MSKEQALAKIDPQAVDRVLPSMTGINYNDIIAKAVDSKAAVEVIKELRAMQFDDMARSAKYEFDAALSQFQAKCPPIVKTRGVKTNSGELAYRFAPLERVEEVIRPIEQEFGFSHVFNQDVKSKDGWVITECIVKHRSGHQETSVSMFPLGNKTAIMSPTQQYAAAISFANRRTLANAYGLVIVGEDRDGAGDDKTKPIINASEPVAKMPAKTADEHRTLRSELWKLLGPDRRGTAQSWELANKILWDWEILDGGNVDDKMPDISVERLKKVIEKVREKLK